MALALIPEPESPALAELADVATDYAENAKAWNTNRAYAADLRDFQRFCIANELTSLPATPQTVARYVAHLARPHLAMNKRGEMMMVPASSVATITRRMTAIAQLHKIARAPNPVADPFVRATLQGLRRKKGTAQTKKTALTGDLLRDVLLTLDASTLKGKRDKAILLLTFALAGRRSEIAALNIEDLRFDHTGLVVTIRRSKTDQAGEGREIGVPRVANEGLCAVRAVKTWIDAAKIGATRDDEGEHALFRVFGLAGYGKEQPLTEKRIAAQCVAILVKRVTEKAGIDGDFAAHSLRAGFITTAASAPGVREVDIQRVSGHRSEKILRGYVRRATVFQDAPLTAIFGSAKE